MHVAASTNILHKRMLEMVAITECHRLRKTKKLICSMSNVVCNIVAIDGKSGIRLYSIYNFKNRIGVVRIEHAEQLITYCQLIKFSFIYIWQLIPGIYNVNKASVDRFFVVMITERACLFELENIYLARSIISFRVEF